MRFDLTALVVSCVSLVGCVPSLQPIHAEKNLVFEPALVGEWRPKESGREESKEAWTFRA